MDEPLLARVEACERANRRLTAALAIVIVLALGGLAATRAAPDVVRANTVEVVDHNGVVRARMAGDLPDAVIGGRRIQRGSGVGGVIIYDSTGQERGGYVTFHNGGNAALTLDGRHIQSTFLLADTSGATALRIWFGSDAVDVRADHDGAQFTAVRGGRVVFQQPEIRDPVATSNCRELRALRSRVPIERLGAACRPRMTDVACQACLGQP
jgi:hypothetical protein